MPLKINEFNINAKIIDDEDIANESIEENSFFQLPDSIKQEIIDECIEKVKELLEKDKVRY